MADWPRDDDNRPGNHCPPPLDAAGQSVDDADGWAHEMASSGRVSGAVAHLLKRRLEMQQGDAIAYRTPGTGDPRTTIGCSWTIG